MALNPSYIVSINLQEYLVDRDTGLPLSNGYIQFFEDTSRTTPKTVYQLTGSPPNYTYTPLSNPVRLSAFGVPVNDDGEQVHIYYYPYDVNGEIQLYYIAVYSEDDVLQFTLEAWPNITAQDDPQINSNSVSNQISNCQFSQVNFVPAEGLVISFDDALSAAVYQIAPDWEVIITSSGAGSLTIQQVALEGSLNIETNPPYKLTFSPSGVTITNLVLRQIFNHNPDIWSTTTDGQGYISGIMLIESLDSQAHTMEMQYVQSGGPSDPQAIVSGSTLTSGYQILNNTVLLNAGTNTDDASMGAVYIDILLPVTGFYSITSIQVVGLNDNNALVQFEQESVNRQIDHLFHYYKPEIFFKPIKSYLCGWDFPLNPAQAYGSSVSTISVACSYVWDQTIIWQSVNSSISVTRGTTENTTGSLNIAVANTCQFCVIQYLTVPQILDLLSNPLSSNIIFSSNQSSLSGCITLWYTDDATLPSINTDHECLVSSVNSQGKPETFNGNWTEINRSNFGDAIFTKNTSVDLNDLESFGFNGWGFDIDNVDLSTVTYFAIVIGYSSVTAGNNVVIQSCSLVPGDIPTIPAPQTANDVLADCQYYYEMSYNVGTIPGTATQTGVKFAVANSYKDQNTSAGATYVNPIGLDYMRPKANNSPINTFYSYLTSNASNSCVIFVCSGGTFPSPTSGTNPVAIQFSNAFTINFNSTERVTYVQNSSSSFLSFTTAANNYTSGIKYHYTSDARLGVY